MGPAACTSQSCPPVPHTAPHASAGQVPAGGARIRGPSLARGPPKARHGPSTSSGTLGVKREASIWKEKRPGAMRGGSRRCPQRRGLPRRVREASAAEDGIRKRLFSLEAQEDDQTSAPQREGVACLQPGNVSPNIHTQRHRCDPGARAACGPDLSNSLPLSHAGMRAGHLFHFRGGL